MNRRNFLTGIAGILAAGCAPRAVSSGVLMPVRDLWLPPQGIAIDFDPSDWLVGDPEWVHFTAHNLFTERKIRLRPEMTITRGIQYR